MDNFNKKVNAIKILIFAFIMAALFVIGLAFFARPEISENEKRELTDAEAAELAEICGDRDTDLSA